MQNQQQQPQTQHSRRVRNCADELHTLAGQLHTARIAYLCVFAYAQNCKLNISKHHSCVCLLYAGDDESELASAMLSIKESQCLLRSLIAKNNHSAVIAYLPSIRRTFGLTQQYNIWFRQSIWCCHMCGTKVTLEYCDRCLSFQFQSAKNIYNIFLLGTRFSHYTKYPLNPFTPSASLQI